MTKDVMLLDVQRVPGLTYNLVSVRAVLDRGKLVEFGYDGCAVKTRDGKVVAFGRQEDKLFMLNVRKKSGRPKHNNDRVGWGGRQEAKSTCKVPHYCYNKEEPRRQQMKWNKEKNVDVKQQKPGDYSNGSDCYDYDETERDKVYDVALGCQEVYDDKGWTVVKSKRSKKRAKGKKFACGWH